MTYVLYVCTIRFGWDARKWRLDLADFLWVQCMYFVSFRLIHDFVIPQLFHSPFNLGDALRFSPWCEGSIPFLFGSWCWFWVDLLISCVPTQGDSCSLCFFSVDFVLIHHSIRFDEVDSWLLCWGCGSISLGGGGDTTLLFIDLIHSPFHLVQMYFICSLILSGREHFVGRRLFRLWATSIRHDWRLGLLPGDNDIHNLRWNEIKFWVSIWEVGIWTCNRKRKTYSNVLPDTTFQLMKSTHEKCYKVFSFLLWEDGGEIPGKRAPLSWRWRWEP